MKLDLGKVLAEGHSEILLPGEFEDRIHADRARDGVPSPGGTVDKLVVASKRFGVTLPPFLA